MKNPYDAHCREIVSDSVKQLLQHFYLEALLRDSHLNWRMNPNRRKLNNCYVVHVPIKIKAGDTFKNFTEALFEMMERKPSNLVPDKDFILLKRDLLKHMRFMESSLLSKDALWPFKAPEEWVVSTYDKKADTFIDPKTNQPIDSEAYVFIAVDADYIQPLIHMMVRFGLEAAKNSVTAEKPNT